MPGLLQLPDELLLETALAVDMAGLLALSLACRQLRSIGQEALLRTAVLPPANIWKLASTLQARPDLAKAFTHMRFGSCDKTTYEKMEVEVEDQVLDATEESHNWNACCDVLTRAYPAVTEHPGSDQKDRSSLHFAVLALIAALAPSLRALTLPTNVLDQVDFMRNLLGNKRENEGVPRSQRQDQVRSLLQSKLHNIQIGHGPDVSYWTRHVSLVGFDVLTDFTGPLTRIFLQGWTFNGDPSLVDLDLEFTDPAEVLPNSLKNVCFYMPMRHSPGEIGWLYKMITTMPNVENLRLQFTTNLYSTAWDLAVYPSAGRQILASLQRLESRVKFTTAFGDATFTKIELTNIGGVNSSERVLEGHLKGALERCLATTHDQMEQDTELREALGYPAR